MEEAISLPEMDENKCAMLGYLARRGQLVKQIEAFDMLWDGLLKQPMQQSWLRLLRIDLRRLRSALKLLEPLLPFEGKAWMEFLRNTAYTLGTIREYDVAIKECDKYCAGQFEIAQPASCWELVGLKSLLSEERREKTEAWLETAKTGCLTTGLQDLLELVESARALSIEEEALANAFLQSRLQSWGLKLCNKLKNEEMQENLEKLHSVRIKVKRFRYAYEVYMKDQGEVVLLECLKNAQDVLGSIHDGSRDIALMENLVAASEQENLREELELFKVWRLAKNGQRLENLSQIRLDLIGALQSNIAGARLL